MTVSSYPSSHRVAGFALGFATAKASSICATKYILSFWEAKNVLLPYIALAVTSLLGALVSIASPDPAPCMVSEEEDVKKAESGSSAWRGSGSGYLSWRRNQRAQGSVGGGGGGGGGRNPSAGISDGWSVADALSGYFATARRRVSRLYRHWFAQFFGLHVAMLLMSVLVPFSFGQSKVLAFLLPVFRHELRMPRIALAAMYSVAVVCGAVLQPGLGALVDELGYRRCFVWLSPVLACGLLLPILAVFVEFDKSLALGMRGGALVLFVALFVVRGTGVTLQTASNALCNQWFDKERGIANAFYQAPFVFLYLTPKS